MGRGAGGGTDANPNGPDVDERSSRKLTGWPASAAHPRRDALRSADVLSGAAI